MNKKQIVQIIAAGLLFLGFSACVLSIPTDLPTEAELCEMAMQYDAYHGTDYAQYYIGGMND